MTDSDNSLDGAAGSASDATFTQDAAIEKLAGILGTDPKLDRIIPEEEGQEKSEADEAEDDAETTEEAPEAEEPEEDADDTDQEAIELADETEIDLGDGRATLKELKEAFKAASLQRADYTRKTQAVSEDRKLVEEKAAAIVERAQQLQTEREYVLGLAQQFLPQPPARPTISAQEDPVAWIEYTAAKEDYDEKMRAVHYHQQQAEAERQRLQQEQQQALSRNVEAERAKLLERFPKLKDPAVAQKTQAEITDVFTREFGFTLEEIANVSDARMMSVMLDALEYRKLKSAAPAVKAKVEAKPPLVKAAKRASPADRQNKELSAMRERLGKTGRRDDAVAILKALDL